MPAVSYHLTINGTPASPEVLAALRRIDVEDHEWLADILRLRLSVAVSQDGSRWSVLDEEVFPRLANITLRVQVGSAIRETLVDAYVIETRAEYSNQPGDSVLEVIAMDATVLMGLEEKIRPWPNMADSDIASTIFSEYSLGEKVEATSPARDAIETTVMQRGSDIQLLRQLAARNGYEVYVEVHPDTGQPEGHFHPPQVDQDPQGVLSVNLGASTNVNSFRARYDMLRPTTATVQGLETSDQSSQGSDVQTPRMSHLGSSAAGSEGRARRIILSQTGLAAGGELQTLAQAVVDESAWSIFAEGDLNTVAYGKIMRAKRPIMVRGAGRQFSGTYYVERVLHTIIGDEYRQHFVLRRNALGLTGQERFVESEALSA